MRSFKSIIWLLLSMNKVQNLYKRSVSPGRLFSHAYFFTVIHKDSDMVLNSFAVGPAISGVIKYALLHPAAQSIRGV